MNEKFNSFEEMFDANQQENEELSNEISNHHYDSMMGQMFKIGQQEYKQLEREIEDNTDALPPVNIIVSGITGVGKSTLINAFFGESVATTGIGKPQTLESNEYSNESTPIHIWDTVGLELDESGEKAKKALDDIRKIIKDKVNNNDKFDKIHAIWYCINAEGRRFQDIEINFIEELYNQGVPMTIILTQCFSKKQNGEFENKIRSMLKDKNNELSDIPIVQVLAKEKEVEIGDETKIIPSRGMKELLNITLDKMPEYLKKGYIAAQRIDKELKRKQSIKEIEDVVNKAKKGLWDKFIIINIVVTDKKIRKMFDNISKCYNTNFSPDALTSVIDNTVAEYKGEEKELLNITPKSLDYFKSHLKYYINKIEIGDKTSLDDEYNIFQKNALLIAVWGLKFVYAVEKVWNEFDEKELQNIELVIEKLKEYLNEERVY